MLATPSLGYLFWHSDGGLGVTPVSADYAERASPSSEPSPAPQSVELSDSHLTSVKVAPVEEREFPLEKEAIGSIDFNEDLSVQVFTPNPGRIINLFAKVGDEVKKGDTLFTIDSPDLLTAES